MSNDPWRGPDRLCPHCDEKTEYRRCPICRGITEAMRGSLPAECEASQGGGAKGDASPDLCVCGGAFTPFNMCRRCGADR